MKVRIDTHVNHVKLGVVKPCENIDCSAMREIIQDHLIRHLTRVSADAFGGDAVVRGEYVHALADLFRKVLLADGDHLRGKILKPAEAAQGLG